MAPTRGIKNAKRIHANRTTLTSLLGLLFSSLILLQLAKESRAFRCYVCDSKDDMECTENVPSDSRLISKDCDSITGAKFCVKTTNIYAGE